MISNAKKLPCGHIFHTACLRSWFQRQQTCPTCRLNILRSTPTATVPPRQAPAGVAGMDAVQPPNNQQNPLQNLPNLNTSQQRKIWSRLF